MRCRPPLRSTPHRRWTAPLSGKRGCTELDVAAFLGVCRVKGPERDRLLALCQEQHTLSWFQQHGSRLPKQLITLIDQDRPASFTFYLHEAALRAPVGGPLVMADQLSYLQRISLRRGLTLRVVPTSLGGHAGMTGAFRLMEFAEFKPVVYLEGETSCLFLERPEEITAYQRILREFADTALDEKQSRELIATLATGLPRRERIDHDRARAGPHRLAHQQLQWRTR
ncbi:MAG: DUF5753 domain-containing protein [Pseudonocardiaceae bacterium]